LTQTYVRLVAGFCPGYPSGTIFELHWPTAVRPALDRLPLSIPAASFCCAPVYPRVGSSRRWQPDHLVCMIGMSELIQVDTNRRSVPYCKDIEAARAARARLAPERNFAQLPSIICCRLGRFCRQILVLGMFGGSRAGFADCHDPEHADAIRGARVVCCEIKKNEVGVCIAVPGFLTGAVRSG
jgi:hypothetical protein